MKALFLRDVFLILVYSNSNLLTFRAFLSSLMELLRMRDDTYGRWELLQFVSQLLKLCLWSVVWLVVDLYCI